MAITGISYGRTFVYETQKRVNEGVLQSTSDAENRFAENLEAAQEFGKELAEQKVVVKMKAGENGKAFGSVSSKEIAKAYADQYKKDLDKKKLVLPDAIKNFGTYEVKVKLHPQVTAVLHVQVVEA